MQQSIGISYSNGFAAAGPFWDRQTDGRTVPITIGDLLRTTSLAGGDRRLTAAKRRGG